MLGVAPGFLCLLLGFAPGVVASGVVGVPGVVASGVVGVAGVAVPAPIGVGVVDGVIPVGGASFGAFGGQPVSTSTTASAIASRTTTPRTFRIISCTTLLGSFGLRDGNQRR